MIQSPVFWIVVLFSVIGFWILPRKLRCGFLATTSFGYLASLDWFSTVVLLAWALLFFGISQRIRTKAGSSKPLVVLSILMILCYLAYFKYVPGLISLIATSAFEERIVIPLGISYFSFKLIHFIVEVARGNIEEFTFSEFICYVLLFPIFTAGPIERFDHFLANRTEQWELDLAVTGLTRIIHGMIKRFVFCTIVHRLQMMTVGSTEGLLQDLGSHSTPQLWIFLLLSSAHAYFDFSAYCDIAIGTSRLFGIRIMENFNFPFFAHNIGEFWKRWHMTLAGWCQAYVYMPLIGITRNPFLAIYATFLTMGLWHAGTLHWVGWGLYHATGVAGYTTWSRYRRRKKWTIFDQRPLKWFGIPLTLIYFSGGAIFVSVYAAERPFFDCIRMMLKLFFVNV